jgi:hypothetical protein
MTDEELIARLRESQSYEWQDPIWETRLAAADRIEALTKERDRLREALDETAQILSQCTFETIRVHGQYIDRREAVSRARAALKGESHD